MIVTCPNCETQFNLPDSGFAPGRKARCSVCSFMFELPDPSAPASPSASAAPEAPAAPEPPSSPAQEKAAQNVMLDEVDTGPKTSLDELLAEHERQEAEAGATPVSDAEPAVAGLPGELDDAGFGGEDEGTGLVPVEKEKKGGRIKRIVFVLVLLLCLGGLGFGGYMIYSGGKMELPFELPFLSSSEKEPEPDPVGERITEIAKVKNLVLIDQDYREVKNKNLGTLLVITGKVRNNFSTPRDYIKVEASLWDKKGNVLQTKEQSCGVIIPDVQLQHFGSVQLNDALNSPYAIIANNTNIQPGMEVPFMVVFIYPSSKAVEYTVVVSDAVDPAEEGQEEQK